MQRVVTDGRFRDQRQRFRVHFQHRFQSTVGCFPCVVARFDLRRQPLLKTFFFGGSLSVAFFQRNGQSLDFREILVDGLESG